MSPEERKRIAHLDAVDAFAGTMVRTHPDLGLISVYPDDYGQWWVQAANTRIIAMDRSGAESLAEKWDRTGDCPVPRRFRITPRNQARSA